MEREDPQEPSELLDPLDLKEPWAKLDDEVYQERKVRTELLDLQEVQDPLVTKDVKVKLGLPEQEEALAQQDPQDLRDLLVTPDDQVK